MFVKRREFEELERPQRRDAYYGKKNKESILPHNASCNVLPSGDEGDDTDCGG